MKPYLISLLVVGFSLLGGTPQANEPIDERRDADSQGQVQISNVSGSIEIIGWDKAQVHVSGYLGDGAQLQFDAGARRVTVSVKECRGKGRMRKSKIIVSVPAASETSANGVSADVTSSGVQGLQRIETVSGDIEAEVFSEDILLKSVSGNLTLMGNGDQIRAELSTINGNIAVDQVSGEVDFTTVSGDVELSAQQISRARANTTNGDVELSMLLASGGRVQVDSINGDVELQVGDATDLNADIETFNGSIENCFDAKVTRGHKHGPGRRLSLSYGTGDRSVRIKTLNGDVELCGDRTN